MTIQVVTTCNASGWKTYGRNMVETFLKHWETDIDLALYAEGFIPPRAMEISVKSFPPWFERWKESLADDKRAHGRDRATNRRRQKYDYRYDCVKFAHKVAAFTDIALDLDPEVDLLICCDADTMTHKNVNTAWLKSMINADAYMAWLERDRTYPECGFLMFNVRHLAHETFMKRLRDTYRHKHVFMFRETHDSYIIQQLVLDCVKRGLFPHPTSLSGNARSRHHPFKFGPLGARLTHFKGNEKYARSWI